MEVEIRRSGGLLGPEGLGRRGSASCGGARATILSHAPRIEVTYLEPEPEERVQASSNSEGLRDVALADSPKHMQRPSPEPMLPRLKSALAFGIVLNFACNEATSEDCSVLNPPARCAGETSGSGETSDPTDTGSVDACVDLHSEQNPGQSGVLRVVNNRAVPIWIPSVTELCMQEPFSLSRDGQRLFWYESGSLPAGIWSCDYELDNACPGVLCSNTDVPVLRLEPGASHTYGWSAYVYVMSMVSAECAAESDCDEEHGCPSGRVLEQGPLQVRLAVSETCESVLCDCAEPDCVVNYGSAGPSTFDAIEVEIEIEESQGSLDLLIEP